MVFGFAEPHSIPLRGVQRNIFSLGVSELPIWRVAQPLGLTFRVADSSRERVGHPEKLNQFLSDDVLEWYHSLRESPSRKKRGRVGHPPVPLGFMNWGFSADAINTLTQQASTNTTWILWYGQIQPAAPTYQITTSYPQWSGTAH